jgi:copper oxidase (laccase) domain-containing protein
MAALGSDPKKMKAAVGPGICVACFYVGEEVAEQFELRFVHRSKNLPPRIDLRAANVQQLEAAGMQFHEVETVARCTKHEPDAFFSYRRDGANIGQMMSFIVAGRRPA